MTDRARVLIAQHAETIRLLGVDFMPLGRPVEVAAPPEIEPDGPTMFAIAEASSAPATPARRDFAPTPPPASNNAAPTRPAPSAPAGVVCIRDCHEHLSDPAAKLDAVRDRYNADAPHQHFVTAHTNIVFGEGDPNARLMFVGEAPGETEDQTGRPFVGRAGQLLEKMINAMGLKREDVYICNVLKTRPPNNATPTSEEARLCFPYLIEQVRIVAPEVIVTLGLPATHLLLGTAEPMRALRGTWRSFDPGPAFGLDPVAVMPTYHPAYLLRSYTDENRRKVWSDLKQVMDRLGRAGGG
jgi:DNA polymerase